ncbi:hypothetical protein [Streptomyces sp. NPDC056049]|uniref:hypothetical protein n=1 Tax=Streptomyces sp. NPDC056049 TaxID=3345693 RepID=UPI0035E0390C
MGKYNCQHCGKIVPLRIGVPYAQVMDDHYQQAGHRRARAGRSAAPGTAGQQHPGCIFVVVALLVVAVVSIVVSANEKPAPADPNPTSEIRDPGYSSSLCEGRDYQVYDDCAY